MGGTISRVAKRILNTLWGALCQRKRLYYNVSNTDPHIFEYPEGEILDSIIPVGDNVWKFQFSNPGNIFKGEYLRIAPFLLAQGRKIISETVEPYKDKVRRIHTDGFILEESSATQAPAISCPENASQTLKALKFEKEGMCHVKNANQVVWE